MTFFFGGEEFDDKISAADYFGICRKPFLFKPYITKANVLRAFNFLASKHGQIHKDWLLVWLAVDGPFQLKQVRKHFDKLVKEKQIFPGPNRFFFSSVIRRNEYARIAAGKREANLRKSTPLPINPEKTDMAVLGKINEEAGEIIKAIGKIMVHGPTAVDTHVLGDGREYDNLHDLSVECGQIQAAIAYAIGRGLLMQSVVTQSQREKLAVYERVLGPLPVKNIPPSGDN